jgi:signal transduction histidine kinase
LYFSQRSNRTGDKAPVIALALVMILITSFCILMYLSDGIMSRYHTLISLMILGSSMLMAVTLAETVFICLYSLVCYALSAYLHFVYLDQHGYWEQTINNLYFILLSGVLGGASSHFYTNARLNDYTLRRQLDMRNRDLEELDRMKSRFFSNISHELRTPLTLVLAPIQDLLQNAPAYDEKFNALIKTAHANALRLLRLVNDLLDVIKLEEGKMQYHGEPVAIGKFMAAMADSMRHLAATHDINLLKQRDTADNVIIADSYLLERIFINLIGNAIKFTPPGGSITVTERYENNNVIVCIADTGIGISAADLPYIFDRFHQAGNSGTHRSQGTGLGLALVKELTEQMHGRIAVTSELGKGTTMSLSFPVQERQPRTSQAGETEPDDVSAGIQPVSDSRARTTVRPVYAIRDPVPPPGDGPLVLVVDDEPDMRSYLINAMQDHYRVLEAQDGEQALRLATRHAPDLVLLDLMLPRVDGLEVCKRLKDMEATRQIKIMLLTARIDEGAKISALNHGADDFLTKPFSRVEVQTRLRNLLQNAQLENKLRMQNRELETTLATLRQTQSQLINSEKINALGRLTAGLLHEINNPLNYSLTALQFIKQDPALQADEILRDTFTDIDEGLTRIKNIISELQIFSHPSEAKRHELFPFREALASAMRFVEKEIGDIKIVQDLQMDDVVVGSRGSIIQVLINLLSNAGKAIIPIRKLRPGQINIRTGHRDGRLFVSLRDNGVGIEASVMANIFDPFFTSRDVGEGMGLGLSICQTIVKNHGGVLSASSEPGQWTEFSFDLPLAGMGSMENGRIELQTAK